MIQIFQLNALTYFTEAIPTVGKVSRPEKISAQLTL